MEIVIKIVLIIVLCRLLYSLYFKLQSKLRRLQKRRQEKKAMEHCEKEREERIKKYKRERELWDKEINNMLPRFINSQCVKECAERIKQTLPPNPYDWSVHIHSDGLIGDDFSMRFYNLGYKNLKNCGEVTAFAKALAFHLGSGFEYYSSSDHEDDYDYLADMYSEHKTFHSDCVRYKSRPLRDI